MGAVDLGTLVIAEEPLRLILELEERGLVLSQVVGNLRVSNKDGTPPELTDEDRNRIKRWKGQLLQIVEWVNAREAETLSPLKGPLTELRPSARKSKSKARDAE